MEFELTKNISVVNDENEASNYQLAEIDERCPQCDEKEVTMPISHVIMTHSRPRTNVMNFNVF